MSRPPRPCGSAPSRGPAVTSASASPSPTAPRKATRRSPSRTTSGSTCPGSWWAPSGRPPWRPPWTKTGSRWSSGPRPSCTTTRAPSSSRRLGPLESPDREELPLVAHAPERVGPPVLQVEVRPGDQVPDGAGHQDLSRGCGVHDPGPDVDADPPDVRPPILDLAGVQPGPDVQPEVP